MQIRIEVDGADRLAKRWLAGSRDVPGALHRGMERSVKYIWGNLPPYPPPPPGSKYRRTETLGREFSADVTPLTGGVVGVIGSVTSYAPWVVSDVAVDDGRGPQAAIHKGRWWTLQEHVRKHVSDVKSFILEELSKLLEA